MPILEIAGRTFAVDDAGFLRQPEIWDDEVARLFAAAQQLDELTEEHWRVLRFIRAYFLEHERAPLIRSLCMKTGLSLGRIYELFPKGPAHGACRIAGLPKPDGCV